MRASGRWRKPYSSGLDCSYCGHCGLVKFLLGGKVEVRVRKAEKMLEKWYDQIDRHEAIDLLRQAHSLSASFSIGWVPCTMSLCVRKAFYRIDRNADGFIDKEEWSNMAHLAAVVCLHSALVHQCGYS